MVCCQVIGPACFAVSHSKTSFSKIWHSSCRHHHHHNLWTGSLTQSTRFNLSKPASLDCTLFSFLVYCADTQSNSMIRVSSVSTCFSLSKECLNSFCWCNDNDSDNDVVTLMQSSQSQLILKSPNNAPKKCISMFISKSLLLIKHC